MADRMKALSAQFVAERHALLGFIYGMVRELAAAEDILQEVWLRLAEAAEREEPIADPAKWCRGVARNLILHYWRDQRTAKVVADSELLDLVEQAFNEQQDSWVERRQALMECIDRLPEKSRQLLQMKYDQGLSLAAMAERLDRSLDSLKMALCRVRQALLECAERKTPSCGAEPMNRLEELLLLWQDQSITADELAELKRLLAIPEGRARVAADFFLTGVVLESLRVQHAAGQLPRETGRPICRRRTSPGRPASGAGRPSAAHGLGSAAAAVLLAVGAVFWFRLAPAPPVSPPVFAQFEQVQGDTFVVSQQQRRPAQAGQVLIPGQGIATQGADSEAVVQMEDSVRLKLGGDTTVFTTTEADKPRQRPAAQDGAGTGRPASWKATRSLNRKRMTVETPLGVAVAETEDTALHVSDSAGVVVVRGEVTFIHKATDKSISVKGGQYVVATAEGDVYAAQLFSGKGQVWATFPPSGLDTNCAGFRGGVCAGQPAAGCRGPQRRDGGSDSAGWMARSCRWSFRGERCVCFSPDGQLLATTEPGDVLLYECSHRTAAARPEACRCPLASDLPGLRSRWQRRWRWAESAGADQGGAVELWDLPTGMLRHTCRGHAGAVTCLAFAPDGKTLATGSLDSTVVLWDPATGKERTRTLMVSAPVVWSLAFAPDGKTLAIATGTDDFRSAPAGRSEVVGRRHGNRADDLARP